MSETKPQRHSVMDRSHCGKCIRAWLCVCLYAMCDVCFWGVCLSVVWLCVALDVLCVSFVWYIWSLYFFLLAVYVPLFFLSAVIFMPCVVSLHSASIMCDM